MVSMGLGLIAVGAAEIASSENDFEQVVEMTKQLILELMSGLFLTP